MIWQLIIRLLDWWEAVKDARQPHIKIPHEWIYSKKGDTRRDE